MTTVAFKDQLRWEALLFAVKSLLNGSHDYGRHAQSWLKDILADLHTTTSSTATCEINNNSDALDEEREDIRTDLQARPDSNPTTTEVADIEGEEQERYVFRLEGEKRHIRFDEVSGYFDDYQGFQHLADLLSCPLNPRTGMELMHGNDQASSEQGFDPLIDDEALANYKTEAYELVTRITKAREEGDPALPMLEEELNKVMQEMMQSRGLSGRRRNLLPDSPETKAFNAVKKNIHRCCDKLEQRGFDSLSTHLKKCIRFDAPTVIYIPSYDPLHPNPVWKI